MAKEKGSEKTGGREKGVPNKKSELKIFIRSLLEDNTKKLEEEIKKLEGKTYVDSVLALLEYAVPKLSRTEFSGDVNVTNEQDVTGWSDEDLKTMSDINKKNRGND